MNFQTIKNKIGVGITTYNSESYFKDLYSTLPSYIDELVVVNGGQPYKERYDCEWIQHKKNQLVSVCRNDCILFLLNRGCEHIFIIEDDMVLMSKDTLKKYIKAKELSGLKYFCYVSTSPGTGTPHNRLPKLVMDYGEDIQIALYGNLCNEFTYHHCSVFEHDMLYDNNLRELLDGELTYREALLEKWAPPFWWFPDLADSDNLVNNNPNAKSRLQNLERPDCRNNVIQKYYEYFYKKYGLHIPQIPDKGKEYTIQLLKKIKNENSSSNSHL